MDSDTGAGIKPPSYVEVNRRDSDIWKCICSLSRQMGYSCHCESYITENADAHIEASPFFPTLHTVSFFFAFRKLCSIRYVSSGCLMTLYASESYILNCEFVLPSILSGCSHHTGGAALGLQPNATRCYYKMMFTNVFGAGLFPFPGW